LIIIQSYILPYNQTENIIMAERVNDIRRGQVLEHNGGLFLVISIIHSQPGKGDAYIQAEMKKISKPEQNTMKYFALM
jgi:translation elongation factor P/translation initiation factor 5A